MNIKNKLYLAFLLTLLLFGISVTAFFIVINNFESFTEIKIGNSLREANFTQLLLNKNNNLILKIDKILLIVQGRESGLIPPSPSSMVKQLDEIVDHTTELGKHIRYCQVLYKKDDSEVKHFRKIEHSINEFSKRTNIFIEMWRSGKNRSDIFQYYLTNIRDYADANETLLVSQYNQSLSEVKEQQEQFKILLANGQKIIAVITGGILLLVFGIVHRTAKSISSPLEKLKQQAQSISKGRYDAKLTITSGNELGQLASAFNDMTATISREMGRRQQAEYKLSQHRDNLQELVDRQTIDLRSAKEKAEAANQAKSLFLTNISHEIRTPLHAILSFTNLTFKRTDDEQSKGFLNNAIISGNRLTGLIDDLLDMSKLEAGMMDTSFKHQDLAIITTHCIAELEGLLHSKQITVEVEAEGPVEGVFDSRLIGRVITNLLSNAIKFSSNGKKIQVTINQFIQVFNTKRQQVLEFIISDQGIGIPEEELDTVFHKFVQSSHTKTSPGGTGLGLAICKDIIDIHKGQIWAENHPDAKISGSVFHFIIPAAQT